MRGAVSTCVAVVTTVNPGGAELRVLPGFVYGPAWARTRTILIQQEAERTGWVTSVSLQPG